MDELFVLDLETTGLDYEFDRILEISIYKLDLKNYAYQKILDEIIWQDITKDFIKNCWVVEQGYISLEEIDSGIDESIIKEKVQSLLYHKEATSFNIEFDFAFLQKQWDVKAIVPYCLMLASTPICRIPGYQGDYKWPRLQEAWQYFYGTLKEEKHRAGSDTELACDIAIALHKLDKRQRIIRQAMQEQNCLIINYTDKKNDATYNRKIAPKELKRNDTLVEAFDYLRNEDRTFNLTRINKIALFEE